jgi:hypothetical protein
MDDGSCMKTPEGRVTGFRLNTQCFSEYQDQHLLLHALRHRYGLDAAIWRDRTFLLIGIRLGSVEDFIAIVEPYIVPSFTYKIGR